MNIDETIKQDRVSNEDEQVTNKDAFKMNLERKMEMLNKAQATGTTDSGEELIFGRRSSISRTPPPKKLRNTSSGGLESMWQDDDLLTSPTFKLVGKPATQENAETSALAQEVGSTNETEQNLTKITFIKGRNEPSQTTTSTTIDIMEDFPWKDDEATVNPILKLYDQAGDGCCRYGSTKKKRKREAREGQCSDKDDEASKEMFDVINYMDKLNKKTEELKKMVKESTKTKTEIKSITRELVGIVGNLNRKVDILKAGWNDGGALRQKGQTAPTNVQTDRIAQKSTASVGVQADESDIKQEMVQQKADMDNKIEKTIESKLCWDGLSKIIDSVWPNSCYKNTEFIDSETWRKRIGNVAVIVNPRGKLEGQIAEDIVMRYPEILSLMEEKLEEGVIEYVKTNTQTVLSRGKTGVSSKILFVVSYEMEPEGTNDIEKLYNILADLGKEAQNQDVKQMNIISLGNIDTR